MTALLARIRLPWHFLDVPPLLQWITSAGLWLLLLFAAMMPTANVPLRSLWELGLAVAICRTLIGAAQLRSSVSPDLLGLAWAIDAALLSGLLKLTGGPYNPFLLMYGVYVWLAVVQGSARWGVFTAIVSAGGFGLFVVDHLHTDPALHHRLNDFPTHLLTIWLSGVAVTELVAHYVRHAQQVLAQRQGWLEEARARAARSEQLASLTALAAGAAHELSTPLATIAVAARELELNAARAALSPNAIAALEDDARLIRVEVDRCRVILDDLSGRAGNDSLACAADHLPALAIAQLSRQRLTDAQRARLRIDVATDVPVPHAAPVELSQAVTSLLRNAFEATGAGGHVDLRVFSLGHIVRIEVEDQGPGMSPDALRLAGEPFYTTKPGQGLGLGLFLVRAFAERVGGSLRFEHRRGTAAILEVPAVGAATS